MKLFVFEGKDDRYIFDAIKELFFSNDIDNITCLYEENIYDLYTRSLKNDEDVDVVQVIKERLNKKGGNTLDNYPLSSDFSEIYLFFDYDFHRKTKTKEYYDIDNLNKQVEELIKYFDNETEKGKLYVSYLMVESIKYMKKLLDNDCWSYEISREECGDFKEISSNFSYYGSLDKK